MEVEINNHFLEELEVLKKVYQVDETIEKQKHQQFKLQSQKNRSLREGSAPRENIEKLQDQIEKVSSEIDIGQKSKRDL